tara:strand:- start:200 stop:436 length:237 start_codon:yes stop_codon:yes gene_type:complete
MSRGNRYFGTDIIDKANAANATDKATRVNMNPRQIAGVGDEPMIEAPIGPINPQKYAMDKAAARKNRTSLSTNDSARG